VHQILRDTGHDEQESASDKSCTRTYAQQSLDACPNRGLKANGDGSDDTEEMTFFFPCAPKLSRARVVQLVTRPLCDRVIADPIPTLCGALVVWPETSVSNSLGEFRLKIWNQ
jgi:hypothetical protein